MNENNQEDQRPSKMRGVVFPKAKYGVIAAIIIIVVGNIFYYKEFLISLLILGSLISEYKSDRSQLGNLLIYLY